jgi:hypothetical protein
VRGELGSSPRILLWTTQNRPILPQPGRWGSGIFWGSGMSGVFAGESGVMGEKTPLPKTLVLQGKVALVA